MQWEDVTLPSNLPFTSRAYSPQMSRITETSVENDSFNSNSTTQPLAQRFNTFMLSSFVSILIVALVLAICAFIGQFLISESKRVTLLLANFRRKSNTPSEKLFFHVNDTVRYYKNVVHQ